MRIDSIDGIRAFIELHRLKPVGARRWQGPLTGGSPSAPPQVGVELQMRSGRPELTLTFRPPTPAPGLSACARGHWLGNRRHLVKTGDPPLDEQVAIRCEDLTALGVLSYPVRVALRLALASGEAVIDDGVLTATVPLEPRHYAPEATPLTHLVTVARALATPQEAWLDGLLALAFTDLDPRVRACVIGHMERHPTLRATLERERELHRTEGTKYLVERLLERSANTRLGAPDRARAFVELVGPLPLSELLPHLQSARELWSELAELANGEAFDTFMAELERQLDLDTLTADPDASLALLELLWGHAPKARPLAALVTSRLSSRLAHPPSVHLVGRLLDTNDEARFGAALDALVALTCDPFELAQHLGTKGLWRLWAWLPGFLSGRPPHPSDIPLLALALAHLPSESERAPAALALLDLVVDRGGHDAEPVLLQTIETAIQQDELVALRAIELLGEVGGAESQVRLARLTGGLFRSSELKRRARASLDRLEARLGALRTGGLALTSTDEGALAVAEDPEP